MRIKFFLYLFFFIGNLMFSQSKNYIDSIHNLPYPVKQKEKNKLIPILLKNAQKSKKSKLLLQEAFCYSDISWCYYFNGNYDENVKYSLQAIALFEKGNFTEFLAREYGELGFRMKNHNLDKAILYMQKGKKIAETNNHLQPLLSIYNNYGALKKSQKQTDSALYYFQKCLKIKEQVKDNNGIPYSLNNIAEIKIEQNNFIEAKQLIDQGLKIREKLNDKYGISDSYAYLGDLFLAEKKYQLALQNYMFSLKIANAFHFNNLQIYDYKKLSFCYEKLNNHLKALENFKKHIQFKDSVLNKETNEKIAELEVKFDTKEKEKKILEKEIEVKNSQNKLIIAFALIGLIAIATYFIYRNQKLKLQQQKQEFELKNAIANIETQNKLQEQRLTISRDLHDNIGAQLTFIISSVENLKFGFPNIDEKISKHLSKISNFTKDTIVELRDTIWAMNCNAIDIVDLRIRLLNFIEKAQFATNETNFKFVIDESLNQNKITSLQGINIYRVIQEAVNNAIKHAKATSIDIDVRMVDNVMVFEINDNGKGFNTEEVAHGNGLYNMKKRIEEIGGNFNITSSKNGTEIKIMI